MVVLCCEISRHEGCELKSRERGTLKPLSWQHLLCGCAGVQDGQLYGALRVKLQKPATMMDVSQRTHHMCGMGKKRSNIPP